MLTAGVSPRSSESRSRRETVEPDVGLAGRDVAVRLPDSLAFFGGEIRARLYGGSSGPVVVILGGISADRFVFDAPGGGPGWWAGLDLPRREVRYLGVDYSHDAEGHAAPSTQEQAEAVAAALSAAGCRRADLVIGASYGGMVALALAEQAPARVSALTVVSAAARPHPYATAWREMQRRIIALGLDNGAAEEAQAIARGLAMLSYRTPEEFAERFAGGIRGTGTRDGSEPGAYLQARGRANCRAMTAERYLSLSASIDRHAVDPSSIAQPTLLIGASSDQLTPPADIEALAEAMPDARLHLIDSPWGHDMFLKEAGRVATLTQEFLESL